MPDRRTLLVEGADDLHVIRHILGIRGITDLCEVQEHEGLNNLLESLSVRLKFAEEGDVLGVVVDADDDLNARWDAVRGRLAEAGLVDVPAYPQADGTILNAPDSLLVDRAGVWIMPDNRGPGKLENLLLSMIPKDDELLEHVTGCVESIAYPRFRQQDKTKALIHTWLAWQARPGRPYGTSIASGFLNHNVPEVDRFVSWLNRLFT